MAIARDFSGKLNMDTHPSKLPKGDYIHALNITHNGGENQDGVVSNIVGTESIAYTEPEGSNSCIGAFADTMRNRIIEFHYNSNSFHFIAIYDNATGIRTKLIESKTDSANVDILMFHHPSVISGIDIIHRDDGDLLFFTDGINRPRGFNVNWIQDLVAAGTPIQEYMICVAKRPPLNALNVTYDSDSNVKVNNLKGKLFQFIYRWVFRDGYKSTWSPISKVILPTDAYNMEVDSDPTRNNVIYLQVSGGGEDYQKIEIGMRLSLGNAWSDFYLVDSLDRDGYEIGPQATYSYKFLNDGAYPQIEVRDSDLLFDRVPDKANAQAMANGNVLVYSGITDGYDPIERDDVNVQITSALINTIPSANNPSQPTITYDAGRTGGEDIIRLYIGSDIEAGNVYRVKFRHPVYAGDDYSVDVSYTATSSDTMPSDITAQLVILINGQTQDMGRPAYASTQSPNVCIVHNTQNPVNRSYPFEDIVVTAVAASGIKSGGSPAFKHSSKYRFGLVYFDEFGKTNGVVSFVSNDDDPNDFSVTTGDFEIQTNSALLAYQQPMIPRIMATISHLPPTWAKRYQWVRTTNLSVSSFLQYITCQVDTDDNYIYFCIQNLDSFRTDNTGFLPSYDFAKGDRIRVICTVNTSGSDPVYSDSYFNADYEIVGVVTRTVTNAGTTETTGRFLKVSKPTGSPTYNPFLLVEIYRPALRTSEQGQVFYEFGESYPIYTAGGVNYHVGETQSQNATQPATFIFDDGDVYFKFRNFYSDSLTATGLFQLGVMDANYSDYWASAVNSNGRPNVIDPNAKLTYSPTLRRHGQVFQEGTDINGLNRFYAEDFDEDNRRYGDVMKMIAKDNAIIVFQKYKIGAIPVDQQMTYNVDGSSNLILSSQLLNKIQYYVGEYGCGDHPESVVLGDSAFYGWDNTRGGTCWRLSQSGIDPISTQYGMQSFAIAEAGTRGGASRIFGVWDAGNKLYISRFEPSSTSAEKTLVWNESTKGFESFLSYQYEMACCLNGKLFTWRFSNMYSHDSAIYNRFYGTSYESSITAVFNDEVAMKKNFGALTILGSEGWDVPQITSNIFSYGSTPQSTSIAEAAFREEEGEFHAAIPRDSNSRGGKINGDPMKGQWAKIKFRMASASSFVFLLAGLLTYSGSPKQPNK